MIRKFFLLNTFQAYNHWNSRALSAVYFIKKFISSEKIHNRKHVCQVLELSWRRIYDNINWDLAESHMKHMFEALDKKLSFLWNSWKFSQFKKIPRYRFKNISNKKSRTRPRSVFKHFIFRQLHFFDSLFSYSTSNHFLRIILHSRNIF